MAGMESIITTESEVATTAEKTDGIEITESALKKLMDTATKESIDFSKTMLRVGVVSGGCSGLSYDLGWDTVKQEKDRVFDVAGITVAMDLKSYLYLVGTTLDFTDGLEGKGFHFHNPQASRTCACGDSFSV